MNVDEQEPNNHEYEELYEDPFLRERRSTRPDHHQSGIRQLVHDYTPAEFRNNVIALAKLGKAFKLPTVLTTGLGLGPNGPFIPEVVSMYPDAPLIDRPGTISAWDDPKVVAAIEKTGRKHLIMAGVTVDVCLAFAAMQAVDAGYNVYGVIDASGGLEVTIRENAVPE